MLMGIICLMLRVEYILRKSGPGGFSKGEKVSLLMLASIHCDVLCFFMTYFSINCIAIDDPMNIG